MQQRIEAGRRAVLQQKELVHRELGKARSEWKHDNSRVTAVDLAVAKDVFAILEGAFSGDDFFSEEMDPQQDTLRREAWYSWVLDPIDGTNNYAAGLSACSISLALLRDGQPVYGYLYDISRSRLMEGGPGFGVLDGGEPVMANEGEPDSSTTIGVHSPRDLSLAPLVGGLAARFKIRALGSSALHLGYVGAGLLDGAVDVNVKVWDIAAAHALCLGGGAEIRYLTGPIFPLDAFDLHMGSIHYCAGGAPVCDALEAVMGEHLGVCRRSQTDS